MGVYNILNQREAKMGTVKNYKIQNNYKLIFNFIWILLFCFYFWLGLILSILFVSNVLFLAFYCEILLIFMVLRFLLFFVFFCFLNWSIVIKLNINFNGLKEQIFNNYWLFKIMLVIECVGMS